MAHSKQHGLVATTTSSWDSACLFSVSLACLPHVSCHVVQRTPAQLSVYDCLMGCLLHPLNKLFRTPAQRQHSGTLWKFAHTFTCTAQTPGCYTPVCIIADTCLAVTTAAHTLPTFSRRAYPVSSTTTHRATHTRWPPTTRYHTLPPTTPTRLRYRLTCGHSGHCTHRATHCTHTLHYTCYAHAVHTTHALPHTPHNILLHAVPPSAPPPPPPTSLQPAPTPHLLLTPRPFTLPMFRQVALNRRRLPSRCLLVSYARACVGMGRRAQHHGHISMTTRTQLSNTKLTWKSIHLIQCYATTSSLLSSDTDMTTLKRTAFISPPSATYPLWTGFGPRLGIPAPHPPPPPQPVSHALKAAWKGLGELLLGGQACALQRTTRRRR